MIKIQPIVVALVTIAQSHFRARCKLTTCANLLQMHFPTTYKPLAVYWPAEQLDQGMHCVVWVFWPVAFLEVIPAHGWHTLSVDIDGGTCSTYPGWHYIRQVS